ncbi:MAG: FumA C-terminus/TtdB family hydratase beta subunit [Oscillospiraceae bacterium]|nr:FumA C-terminus/TtdB family hydratase beta subunit [Oscillospiraceae bacterium]
MSILKLNAAELKSAAFSLKSGDRVALSGTVYTARDAAHKRISALVNSGGILPFSVEGATIYYAGPTGTPDNLAIGSCGPTTSGRMDTFAPMLYDMGLAATIGKGARNSDVVSAIVRNRAVYFAAIGGCGALASECITDCEVIAFPELGCESVKRLAFREFPLIVAVDSEGNDIYKR